MKSKADPPPECDASFTIHCLTPGWRPCVHDSLPDTEASPPLRTLRVQPCKDMSMGAHNGGNKDCK
jgi:hypothetical protein